MKLIASILFLLITFNISMAQRSKENLRSMKEKLPKGLSFEYDRFDGIIWIGNKDFSVGTMPRVEFRLYFGIYDNGEITSMRLKQKYYGSNWLFIKCFKYLLGKASEEQRRYSICSDKFERDTYSGGTISEMTDIALNDEAKAFLIDFTTTKCNLVIKIEGDTKYNTTAWSPIFNTKFPDMLKLVIDAYKIYGGKF